MDKQILDIFYNQIVKEAQNGKIDCYFILNIAFNLVIDNKEISKCLDTSNIGSFIPTLKITNKQLFDEYLIEYVLKALKFYDVSNFYFLNDVDDDELKKEYQIKYIICNLFANASLDDFNNPIDFLQSRTLMFDNRIINLEEEIDLGYLESIHARIFVKEEKSPIKSETPYRIKSYLEFDDGYKLLLPEIYAGNNKEKYKLYGIQKTTNSDEEKEKPYLKQIRKGLIAKTNGAKEHYFLAVMLFISFCSDKEIEVVPFLIERWNAKKIAYYNKSKRDKNLSLSDIDYIQDKIQNNITNTLIHYFKNLEDTCSGINFYSYPFEIDSSLHIKIEPNLESRNIVFNEIYKLVKEYKDLNIKQK